MINASDVNKIKDAIDKLSDIVDAEYIQLMPPCTDPSARAMEFMIHMLVHDSSPKAQRLEVLETFARIESLVWRDKQNFD